MPRHHRWWRHHRGGWDAIALGVLAEPIRAAKLLIDHEQPDLIDQITDLFTPVEDRPLTRGPGPADYPVNDRDVPADPTGEPPDDLPDRTREAVLLRNPLSRFPYSTSLNRGNDIDHTIAYRDSGPPGQTRPEHLGPAARPEHRYKTFGPIDVRQPAPDHCA